MKREDYFSLSELQLPENIWEPLAQVNTPKKYSPHQIIYLQGSSADQFYYIVSGQVRAYISDEGGTEKLLTEYSSGNLFGEAAFFDQRPRVSNAVAVTECRLVSVNREQITDIIQKNPDMAMALLKYLARTVRMLSDQLDDATFLQADRRLARLLLGAFSSGPVIHVTQEELAAAVGVTRVTASRILNEFSRKGIIETGYRCVRLRSMELLMQAAGTDE